MTINESLRAVKSDLVQGRVIIMEPGGIEPLGFAGFEAVRGV